MGEYKTKRKEQHLNQKIPTYRAKNTYRKKWLRKTLQLALTLVLPTHV